MTDQAPTGPDSVVRVLLSIAVLLLLVIAGMMAFQSLTGPSETWSYTIIAPKDENLITDLNRAGALGWEVVSARRATNGEGDNTTASYELILKRRGTTPPAAGEPISPK